MTAFKYRALNIEGTESSGVLEAETGKVARNLLREKDLFPIEIHSINNASSGRKFVSHKLKLSDLTQITRQLATLLSSGLTVEQSLYALTEQAETDSIKQILAGVRSEILSGYSFHRALDRYPLAFPTLYKATISAGEKSGELAEVMNQLADYLDRNNQLRSKTLQALLYPIIVAFVALLVIIGLMTYVVPQVVSVFQQGQQKLPLLTVILINVSDVLREWGLVMILSIIVIFLTVRKCLQNPTIKNKWDTWLLGLPIVGRYLLTLNVTRFASTLSILSRSGVPLLVALEACSQVISRIPLSEAVRTASDRVREGQPLSKALGATRQFPVLLIHMIANGEATGRTDELLDKAARLQQSELETRTATITTLIEPILLLTMGGFVLLIVMAVMQPIIELNTLMK